MLTVAFDLVASQRADTCLRGGLSECPCQDQDETIRIISHEFLRRKCHMFATSQILFASQISSVTNAMLMSSEREEKREGGCALKYNVMSG